MAATAAELPILSFGHTIQQTSKYKYKKPMKLPNKQPALPEKKEERDSTNREGGALKKVGAFGVSVRKAQIPDYAKHERLERVTVDRFTSPIKEVTEEEEEDELVSDSFRKLPRVEISLTKKIKRRIMLRHATNADALTSSDRQVLEDLRQGLRTTGPKEHGGTKSVLEAMGDPKLREARFLYEPLNKFLSGTERHGVSKTLRKSPFSKGASNGYNLASQGFPQDLRLINTMVPPSQQHFNTPVDPRQLLASSNSFKPSRAGSKHGFPISPKVPHHISRQLGTKEETRESNRLRTSHTLPEPSKLNEYSLSPSSGYKNDSENGRKTDISLPSITLYVQKDQLNQEVATSNNSRSRTKQPTTAKYQDRSYNRNNTNQEAHAVRRAPRTTRPRVGRPLATTRGGGGGGFSTGAKMTATGKSHLIGPMNKMDMIVEYSKLLQSKVINYEQYIKMLSKLSLHKIDLGKSGLRQYHIVRDATTGMKPRLARVDIHPSKAPAIADQERAASPHDNTDAKRAGKQRSRVTDPPTSNHDMSTRQLISVMGQSRGTTGTIATPYDSSSPYKTSQLRLGRVSIGEGIPESRLEYINSGFDITSGEYLTYDDITQMQGREMDRYRGAHRPLPNSDKRPYHWTHMPPSTQGIGRRNDPSAELYSGYSGRLLPNSREIKKRLNFSYPSYDVTVDGTNHVLADENTNPNMSSGDQGINGDSSHDPDYLAITLDQPRERVSFIERPSVTSSLSVHDVTIPTEVKVITGKLLKKTTNGPQRMGLGLEYKDTPKQKDVGSNSIRVETLNITPIAITNSNIVNSNPSSSRSPYYVSQDDFAATGTDGVLQNHLNTIYKSINRAKSKNPAPGKVVQPGKNSPPDVTITRMSPAKNTYSPQEEDTIIEKTAKLLQPGKRFPPPNTPPPKTVRREATNPEKGESNIFIPPPNDDVKISHPYTSLETPSSLPALPIAVTIGSPPPTDFLLKTREDEVTSFDDSDDSDEFNDVITLTVHPTHADDSNEQVSLQKTAST